MREGFYNCSMLMLKNELFISDRMLKTIPTFDYIYNLYISSWICGSLTTICDHGQQPRDQTPTSHGYTETGQRIVFTQNMEISPCPLTLYPSGGESKT